MITIKEMKWSNFFSYGEDNHISFVGNNIAQISGSNGSGKSSIPLIIEEVLYGKNSRGIKKQSIPNRYIDKPSLYAELDFISDNDTYKVILVRKSTIKLQLLKNGEDISSHSSTNTFKTIQEILGLDFKTFTQLIYQSSTNSLEFLKATDTTRKKFLVTLFNLNNYLVTHDIFKKASSAITTDIATLSGKLSTITAWIDSHIDDDLTHKIVQNLPVLDNAKIDELSDNKAELSTLTKTNKEINANNQYKKLRNGLDISIISEAILVPANKRELNSSNTTLNKQSVELTTKGTLLKNEITKIEKLGDVCHVCSSKIDQEEKQRIIDVNTESILEIRKDLTKVNFEKKVIVEKLSEITKTEKRLAEKNKVEDELTRLSILIDDELQNDVIIEKDLSSNITKLSKEITDIQSRITKISKENSLIDQHNSKVDVIKEQLTEYKAQLGTLHKDNKDLMKLKANLEVLKKAFSTNGLIGYKLDYLIKDLELQINLYLEELSSGQFQIVFVLQGEKLNVDIIDDGKTITIEELSAGELARINTSTLLAIRKLMAAISSTKLNILFLDEVMGVLDDSGKEKLIELLHNEKELNTFLVSHEYSHPLIPQIHIIKENRISRVDHG